MNQIGDETCPNKTACHCDKECQASSTPSVFLRLEITNDWKNNDTLTLNSCKILKVRKQTKRISCHNREAKITHLPFENSNILDIATNQ